MGQQLKSFASSLGKQTQCSLVLNVAFRGILHLASRSVSFLSVLICGWL